MPTPISKMVSAGALAGTELVEVTKLSSSITITAATLSAAAADNSFNDSGSGFLTAGFAAEMHVNVTGFTGNVVNNLASGKILSVVAGKMIIESPDGDLIVNDAAGESVTITAWITRRTTAAALGGSADIAALIHAATGKTTPVDADELGIVDSAASNVLKKLTWANLKAGIWSALGALIAAGTSKSTPVDADSLAIADSAAGSATKQLTWANLKATLKTYLDTVHATIGAITGSGLTMATGKLLGRSTASTGAVEEITVGSGLSLSAGTLSATGSGSVTTTGSPSSGQMAKFSGASSITNATAATDYVGPGAITTSGLTMATAKLLGRSTASTGAVEAITVGTGLTLSAGTLSASSGTNIVDKNWFDVTAYGATGNGSTDDTAAIQSAIDACETAGGGTVYFPKGTYKVNGALQDTSRSNAQLLLPRRDYADTEAITIVFRGEAPPPAVVSVIGATPLPDNLSIIKGTLNTGTNASMIGSHGPAGTFNNFTNILFVMRDLIVQMPSDPVLTALDLSCVAQIDIDQVCVHAGSFDVASISAQTTSTSFGLRGPGNGNGAIARLGIVNVVGFYKGYEFGEHTHGQDVTAWGCKQAFNFIAADHSTQFDRLMAVHCQKALCATGNHYTNISELNIEHAASGTWVPVYDIDDSNGYIRGSARWHVVLAVSGVDDTLTINGLSSFNNGLRLRLERIGKWFQYGLTDGASIAVPGYISNQFRVTLGGNRTLSNPTGLNDGDVFSVRIKQDGTGSRTLAYGSMYKFAGGTAPVLTATANALDFLTCQYDMSDGTLFCSMIKDVK